MAESNKTPKYGMPLRTTDSLYRNSSFVTIRLAKKPDLPIEYISSNVADKLGYEHKDLINKNVSYLCLVHPDDRKIFEEEIKALGKKCGSSIVQKYRIKHACGKYIHVEDYKTISKSTNGRTTHYEGFVLAVENEDTSIKGDEVYKKLSDDMPVYFCSFLPDGILTYTNNLFASLLKSDSARIIGKNIFELFSTELSSKLKYRLLDLTIQEPIKTHELGEEFNDGTKRCFQWTNRAFFDTSNQLTHYQAIGIDISGLKYVERVLREKEYQLSNLIESIPDAVFFKDEKGRWEITNNVARKLFRLQNVDWKGKTDLELSEINLPMREAHLYCIKTDESTIQAKTLTRSEEIIPDEEGLLHHFDTIKVPLIDEENNNNGLVIVGRDISDRKKAENALKEKDIHSQSLLRLARNLERAETFTEVLDAALDEVKIIFGYKSLWVYLLTEDRRYFKAQMANGNAAKFVMSEDGTATLAVKGDLMLEEIADAKDIVIVKDACNDPRTNKKIVELTGAKTIINIPIILFDKHLGCIGTGTFAEEGIRVPTETEKDYLIAISSHLAVALDRIHLLEERVSAEDRLKVLSHSVEQNPVSIVITDPEGSIEYVNPKFTEVTGYSLDEIIGNNLRILQSGGLPKTDYDKLWNTILSGRVWNGEFLNKKKDGALYWEDASISPILNERGEITHFVGVKEDITEKKKIVEELIIAKDKAEEMNRLKSHFFANMSHELRTPFVGIMGFAELLAEQAAKPEQKEMAERIISSSKRLTSTLNSILNMSKIEFREIEINVTSVDVVQLIELLCIQFERSARLKNLVIRKKHSLNGVCAKTDEHLLSEILFNLLDNAIKFTEYGWIEISTQTITKGADFLLIKVKDTGIGIPENKREQIWEDFRQVSEGTTRSYEGTGLGLSIAQKYCSMINGNLYLERNNERGSTFVLEIPLQTASKPKNDKKNSNGNLNNNGKVNLTGSKRKILYVEDDELARFVIKKSLSKKFEIETAETSREVLSMINERKFDIILMDINLGKDISGIELTKIIRTVTGYEKIPVVAVTAFAQKEEREEFLKKGMDYYISKPFLMSELEKLVNKAFEEVERK
jgi:PAS domain S-box-containing protein